MNPMEAGGSKNPESAPKARTARMAPATSVYLDLIRIIAASGVFLSHAGHGFFSSNVNILPQSAHGRMVLFFAIHLIAFNHWAQPVSMAAVQQPSNAVRRIADRTFSLYAYHMPLMVMLGAAAPYAKDSPVQVMLILASTLLVIGLLSEFTEQRRAPVKSLLLKWLHRRKNGTP